MASRAWRRMYGRAASTLSPSLTPCACFTCGHLTIAEDVTGYVSQGWFGYIAPVAVSREIVACLNKAINEAMSFPDVREKMTLAGIGVLAGTARYFRGCDCHGYWGVGK